MGVSAEVGFEASQTFSNSTTHSVSRETSQSNQRQAEQASTDEVSTGVSYEDGTLQATLQIRNASDALSFEVSDLVIIAKYFDPAIGRQRTIAELYPTERDFTTTMAAGDSIELIFENSEVDPDKIMAIMANPTALTFEISRYGLSRPDPRDADASIDYAALAGYTKLQTGLIIVDFGDGRVERYNVATNLRRDEDGLIEGVTMEEVMQILADRKSFELDADGNLMGVDGTLAIENVEEFQKSSFWVVLGKNADQGFAQTRVMPNQTVMLAFMEDNDGDYVADRYEPMFGTDPELHDTDADGLCDGPHAVYECWGTEIHEAIVTGATRDFGRVGGAMLVSDGLTGYFDMQGLTLADGNVVSDGSSAANHGDLSVTGAGVRTVTDRFGSEERALAFSNGDSDFGGVVVEGLTAGVVPQIGGRVDHLITLAAWVKPETRDGAIMEIGNFVVSIQDGRLSGRIGTQTALGPELADDEWTHVAVTFSVMNHPFHGGQLASFYYMGVFVNGALATTKNFSEITQPADHILGDLEIGNPYDGPMGFAGGLDDVRVYDRQLSVVEIGSLAADR